LGNDGEESGRLEKCQIGLKRRVPKSRVYGRRLERGSEQEKYGGLERSARVGEMEMYGASKQVSPVRVQDRTGDEEEEGEPKACFYTE